MSAPTEVRRPIYLLTAGITLKIRIGTRKSKLALAQAEMVGNALSAVGEVELEFVPLVTTGDRKQTAPESTPRDKTDWIAEIETALVQGDIDLAVHSGKDIPVEVHPDTLLIPVLRRETPNDCFVVRDALKGKIFFDALPHGAKIGTSSLRRRAQLLRRRPDLKVVPYRGNVTTRLERFAIDETYDAIVLAQAGLERLELAQQSSGLLSIDEFLPAVAQGILAVQVLQSNGSLQMLARKLTHPEVDRAWTAERSVIRKLGADCRSAVGVFADAGGAEITLVCRVLSEDGKESLEESGRGTDPITLGEQVAERLINLGAQRLLG